MQFLVVGRDGTDEGAPQRRMAVRDAHIARIDDLLASGAMLFGTAILDGDDQMTGSMMVVQFESREALDEWLAAEPYVTGSVWASVTVEPCRVGPSFEHLLPK